MDIQKLHEQKRELEQSLECIISEIADLECDAHNIEAELSKVEKQIALISDGWVVGPYRPGQIAGATALGIKLQPENN